MKILYTTASRFVLSDFERVTGSEIAIYDDGDGLLRLMGNEGAVYEFAALGTVEETMAVAD